MSQQEIFEDMRRTQAAREKRRRPNWPNKFFILYDGRAKIDENTDRASVLGTASSETEASREGKDTWGGHDAIWWEYDCDHEGKLTHGVARWDFPPCCS